MGTQRTGIKRMEEGRRGSAGDGCFSNSSLLVLSCARRQAPPAPLKKQSSSPRVGRLTSVAWVVVFLISWLSAGRASANSAPLPVSFEGTGQALPQAEIRVAIATELGRETLAEG